MSCVGVMKEKNKSEKTLKEDETRGASKPAGQLFPWEDVPAGIQVQGETSRPRLAEQKPDVTVRSRDM